MGLLGRSQGRHDRLLHGGLPSDQPVDRESAGEDFAHRGAESSSPSTPGRDRQARRHEGHELGSPRRPLNRSLASHTRSRSDDHDLSFSLTSSWTDEKENVQSWRREARRETRKPKRRLRDHNKGEARRDPQTETTNRRERESEVEDDNRKQDKRKIKLHVLHLSRAPCNKSDMSRNKRQRDRITTLRPNLPLPDHPTLYDILPRLPPSERRQW